MNFPEECKSPISKAMYLVDKAGEAWKNGNKNVQAFLAPATQSFLFKELPGQHSSIQTRIVVLGLEDLPVEVLFLNNNNDRVMARLSELAVPFSTNPTECREARVVAIKVKKPETVVPSIYPVDRKAEEDKDLAKPKKKRGRPPKKKTVRDLEREAREKERAEKWGRPAGGKKKDK